MKRKSNSKLLKNPEEYDKLLTEYHALLKDLTSKYPAKKKDDYAELVNFKSNKESSR